MQCHTHYLPAEGERVILVTEVTGASPDVPEAQGWTSLADPTFIGPL